VMLYVFCACCFKLCRLYRCLQWFPKASEWVGIYISHVDEKSDAGIRTVEYGFGDSTFAVNVFIPLFCAIIDSCIEVGIQFQSEI
jgi:hypothetical protein